MTKKWHFLFAIAWLASMAQPLWAQEPSVGELPLCQRLKSRCVVAPYCPKVAPCAPCYALQVSCIPYCKKPDVACAEVCFEWCTSIYCKKCEPCYPGDPCERQVWHSPPCQPLCQQLCTAELDEPVGTAMIARRFAY